MNVLLVDDESMMRKMVKLALQKRGFAVFDAASGADALALSKEHAIDLLVTDVVMGEMDGTTLAHSIVERRPDLPVLFISGYPMDFEVERRHYSRCGFLRKPFQTGELVNAITELSEGSPRQA
jgi:two-component system cell cycle sensor histidine kinase/response regulator CckA